MSLDLTARSLGAGIERYLERFDALGKRVVSVNVRLDVRKAPTFVLFPDREFDSFFYFKFRGSDQADQSASKISLMMPPLFAWLGEELSRLKPPAEPYRCIVETEIADASLVKWNLWKERTCVVHTVVYPDGLRSRMELAGVLHRDEAPCMACLLAGIKERTGSADSGNLLHC